MKRKVYLSTIAIAIVSSFSAGLIAAGDLWPKANGGNSKANIVAMDTGANGANMIYSFSQAGDKPEQKLIGVINGARKTLDIAIYSLTHPDIVAAIRDARKRGVTVRLITDKQQSGGKSNIEALKILGSAGIPLKQNSHSGLMHLKMTIADGAVATTGSFNYTKSASTTNDEVLVVINNRELAQKFTAEFESMWNDSKNFATITKYIGQPGDVSDAEE